MLALLAVSMFKKPSISPARPLLKPPVIILERRTRLPGGKSPYMSLSLVRSVVSFPAVLLDIKKNNLCCRPDVRIARLY